MNQTPNVDRLAGKRCPKCGSYGPFKLFANTSVIMTDDASPEFEHEPWIADDDDALCPACLYEAMWSDFDEPGERDDDLEDVPKAGDQLTIREDKDE